MLSDMCCTVLAKHSAVSTIEEYPKDILYTSTFEQVK